MLKAIQLDQTRCRRQFGRRVLHDLVFAVDVHEVTVVVVAQNGEIAVVGQRVFIARLFRGAEWLRLFRRQFSGWGQVGAHVGLIEADRSAHVIPRQVNIVRDVFRLIGWHQ
ncbi:hypothetical protein D9M71_494480 [compost metagenome]